MENNAQQEKEQSTEENKKTTMQPSALAIPIEITAGELPEELKTKIKE